MEQVQVLLPLPHGDHGADFYLQTLSQVELTCLNWKEVLENYLQENHDVVQFESFISSHIITFITVLKQLSPFIDMLSCTSKKEETESKYWEEVWNRFDQVISDTVCACYDSLPIIPEINIKLFLDMYFQSLKLLSIIESLLNLSKGNVGLRSSIDNWRIECIEGFCQQLEDCITLSIIRCDWTAHSMYQRNKRFTPGVIAHASKIREFLHGLCQCDVVYLPHCLNLGLYIIEKGLTEVLRVYFNDVSTSRVRLWQYKADLIYTLLAVVDTVKYIAIILPSISNGYNSVDSDRISTSVNLVLLNLHYLLCGLSIITTSRANEVIEHCQSILVQLTSPSRSIIQSNSYNIIDLVNAVESLILTHTNIKPNSSQTILDHFQLTVDLTCLQGFQEVDNSDSLFVTQQGKLIDIVNMFICSPPISNNASSNHYCSLSTVFRHAYDLSQLTTKPAARDTCYLDILINIMERRFELLDCSYPQLSNEQKEDAEILKKYISTLQEKPSI
jgi:hypothetical protein